MNYKKVNRTLVKSASSSIKVNLESSRFNSPFMYLWADTFQHLFIVLGLRFFLFLCIFSAVCVCLYVCVLAKFITWCFRRFSHELWKSLYASPGVPWAREYKHIYHTHTQTLIPPYLQISHDQFGNYLLFCKRAAARERKSDINGKQTNKKSLVKLRDKTKWQWTSR